MNNKYETQDILDAINILLNNRNREKPLILKKEEEKPLELINEVKNYKVQADEVPKNTEKIILQAEKYLKK
tara:strand:- start:757 stop:969 length:213 start_codon:yes stop_codon:yes gene_type:complete